MAIIGFANPMTNAPFFGILTSRVPPPLFPKVLQAIIVSNQVIRPAAYATAGILFAAVGLHAVYAIAAAVSTLASLNFILALVSERPRLARELHFTMTVVPPGRARIDEHHREMSSKRRLDVLLVERGLAESRAQAQALVMAGRVPGHTKPGEQVDDEAPLEVDAPPPYVSRAGHKLANALDAFGIDVAGLDALDVGASTGGFTDVLLQRGAARVIALDVGYGQLHSTDPRRPARDGARAGQRHGRSPSCRSRRSSSRATSRSSR